MKVDNDENFQILGGTSIPHANYWLQLDLFKNFAWELKCPSNLENSMKFYLHLQVTFMHAIKQTRNVKAGESLLK